MRPADIANQRVIEELDVATTGNAVIAIRSVERGRYVSRLHLVDIDTDALDQARPVTSGRVVDRSPRLTPDGSVVAFLRSDPDQEDAPAKLCTVRLDGRRPGRLHRLAPSGRRPVHGAISELAWSPDGTRLAFTADVDPPRFIVGRRTPVGDTKSTTPVARHIVRTDWRLDGVGHRDHWAHLFVLDVGGADGGADGGTYDATTARRRPRQLTSGDWGVSGITWAPDGGSIAFVADPGADSDLRPHPRIWSVDAIGESEPRLVLDAPGGATRPAYSPDGRWLAAVGNMAPAPLDDAIPGLLLVRGDTRRRTSPIEVSPDLDRHIGNWADCDLNGWMVGGRPGPVWADERTIVAVVTNRGRSLPERWVIDRRTGRTIDAPTFAEPRAEAMTESIAVVPASPTRPARIAMLATLGTRAMELMTADLADPSLGPKRNLAHGIPRGFVTHTTTGSAWQRQLALPDMTCVAVPGPGGDIDVWIASPASAGSNPLPTIVDVHGGPLGCWGPTPPIEVLLLTGAGYRVVLPNIRGSAGYGASWIAPQLGDWGGVDAADVHTALDYVVDRGLANPTRLGALGLSYGGFMVNWLVGTSDRFAAAVSENGVTNQVAVWANSDTGPEYNRAALMGDPLSALGVESLWRQSPLRHVAAIDTPLLLLQAEADLRCPAQDNEQFFIALRHLGRTVEYVVYPDEFHVFAAAGRPDRRVDRMERVIDWFARYL